MSEILDFNKLEDQFFCIDVLTRARFSIQSTEPELSEDINRIITSLTAYSQNPPKERILEAPTHEISVKEESEVTEEIDDDNDEIVDLLTGEKI